MKPSSYTTAFMFCCDMVPVILIPRRIVKKVNNNLQRLLRFLIYMIVNNTYSYEPQVSVEFLLFPYLF